MSSVKFPKGATRDGRSFTRLAREMFPDNPSLQKELQEFFTSVAMKTDIKHINLYESSGAMGTALQHVAMNAAADELTWIDPASGGNLSCATMAINVAALADDTDLNMDTSGWAAVYDPDSWVTPTKGITAPTDGVYIIKAYSECELYYDSEEHNATAIAFNRLYLYHNDSSDVLVKMRHCYHYIVTQFTKFYGPTSWNSETEEYSYDHIGFGEIVNSDYGNCHIYAVVEMSAGDYIEVEFLHQNEPFDVTAEVDIELSMVRIKDLS